MSVQKRVSVLQKRKEIVAEAIDSYKERIKRLREEIQENKHEIACLQSLQLPLADVTFDLFTGYKSDNVLRYRTNKDLTDLYVTNDMDLILKDITIGPDRCNPFGRFYNLNNECVELCMETGCGCYWFLSSNVITDKEGNRGPLSKNHFATVSEIHNHEESDIRQGPDRSLREYILAVTAKGFYFLTLQNDKGEYQYYEDRHLISKHVR